MYGYNAEAEEIFDAWTSGTVIGAGKTLEAYYTVCLNGNGKYVDFQGNTPTSGYTIERVIYVKSDGLADHTSTSGWTSPSGLQPTASSSAGPTIAECWVAINEYLTKFSGSQNNFTFLISYDEIPPADYLLLNDYPGAEAAYSLRLLDKDYTGDAVRVRRASDNTEQDIGFDANGDLDTSALGTFCSGTDGFVKTWYDQSGNGNDATQTTAGNQPKIYDSSTGVIEEGSAGNEKPAIDFDGTNDGLNCSTNLRAATGASTVIMVRNLPTSSNIQNAFSFYKVQRHLIDDFSGPYEEMMISTNETTNEFIRYASADLNGQRLYVSAWDGTTQTGGVDNVSLHIDGTEEPQTVGTATTGVTASGTNSIGYRHDTSSQYSDGTFQEVIVYLTDESSNRSGIETNINDYYNIY
jgi:hypothetical protein